MRRSLFFLIVVLGGIGVIVAVLFFIVGNPYETINPTESETPAAQPTLPSATDAPDAEISTIRTTPTLGLTVGVDGSRLVFFDEPSGKILVTEFDGSSEQALSDKLVGVSAMGVAPTKDRAWLQIDDPESEDRITLVYDFRAREAVRLENGITSIDWSPEGDSLIYYVDREGNPPMLRIVDYSGIDPRSIRENFVLQDPIVRWYEDNHISFWQLPIETRPSSIVTMRTNGAEASELLGEFPSAQAIFSPDGNRVLVSHNDPASGKSVLRLGDTETAEFRDVSLTTWVDKCTWTADSSRILCFVPQNLKGGFVYPEDDTDDVDYRDRLWSIEAQTGKPTRIFDIPEGIANAVSPVVSQDTTRLTFIDKSTGVLVSLDLTGKISAPTKPTQDVTGSTIPIEQNSPINSLVAP
jgi:hypothetical protein